jgi:hypothetical protein
MARPAKGARLVRSLEGEAKAKERLEVILQTLAGELAIREACEDLDVSEARFHQLRQEALKGALARLEPKARGRPKRAEPTPEAEQIAALEAEVDDLKTELLGSQLREELSTLLPSREKKGPTQSEEERRASGGERKRRRRERRLARGAEGRAEREARAKSDAPVEG